MSDAFHDAGESYGFSCGGNITKEYMDAQEMCKDVATKKSKKKPIDNPVVPDHYNKQCSISCIDSMIAVFGTIGVYYFCLGSSYKYLWRYKNKNGLEDLSKAREYLILIKDLKIITPVSHWARETPEYNRILEMYNKVCHDIGEPQRELIIDVMPG